jgi:hypothetical protein
MIGKLERIWKEKSVDKQSQTLPVYVGKGRGKPREAYLRITSDLVEIRSGHFQDANPTRYR